MTKAKNKSAHVMTPARKAALKKAVEAAKNRAVAKAAAPCTVQRNMNKEALEKAIKDREQPKTETKEVHRYHIWDVYGVKYLMDKDNVPTRRVSVINVTADHDTANEPEYRNELIAEAEDALLNDGFSLTDADAMEEALKTAERVVDEIRHDLKYGCACPKCVAANLDDFVKWLEYLRSWRAKRDDLAYRLGGTCNLPPVIPNDYQENWHIEENGKYKHLVPNTPTIKEEHVKIIKDPKEVPPEVLKILGDLHKQGLIKDMPEILKQLPGCSAKKALPNKK